MSAYVPKLGMPDWGHTAVGRPEARNRVARPVTSWEATKMYRATDVGTHLSKVQRVGAGSRVSGARLDSVSATANRGLQIHLKPTAPDVAARQLDEWVQTFGGVQKDLGDTVRTPATQPAREVTETIRRKREAPTALRFGSRNRPNRRGVDLEAQAVTESVRLWLAHGEIGDSESVVAALDVLANRYARADQERSGIASALGASLRFTPRNAGDLAAFAMAASVLQRPVVTKRFRDTALSSLVNGWWDLVPSS